MTLRDYFAAAALVLYTNCTSVPNEEIVEHVYEVADLMLAERQKR